MKRQLWNGHALQLNPQIKEQFRVCTTVEIPEQKMTSIGFGALAVLFTCSLIHRHTTDDGWQKTVKITLGQPVGTNLQLLWLKFSLCDIRRPAKEELGSLWKTQILAVRHKETSKRGGGFAVKDSHWSTEEAAEAATGQQQQGAGGTLRPAQGAILELPNTQHTPVSFVTTSRPYAPTVERHKKCTHPSLRHVED